MVVFSLASIATAHPHSAPEKELEHSPGSVTGFKKVEGSPIALERLSLLFKNLGGRTLWAEAQSLHLIQKSRDAEVGYGVLSMSWHDLESPGGWADVEYPGFSLRYAWTETGGWLNRKGKFRDLEAPELAEKVSFWSRDLYTLYHQLAADQIAFKVEPLKPYGFVVFNPDGLKVAEFHMTNEGELYQWRSIGLKKDHAMIFGPYVSFGRARFPVWSAMPDGQWSAQQVQVSLSPKPFRENVSLKKPVREWEGGAIHSNCEN